ncbi:hypothetical protein EB077_13355 [bacterium]|nr:hypothetical protein [bacterium]NDG28039.1 hypothetical protein [Pseudomonadota bacterium]
MGKPKKAFRNKGIDIAAWENDRGGVSFTFRKTYKNKETGEYKETKYLFANDLKDLRDLITEVLTWNETLADRTEHKYAAAANGAEAMAAKIASGADVKFEDDEDQIPF